MHVIKRLQAMLSNAYHHVKWHHVPSPPLRPSWQQCGAVLPFLPSDSALRPTQNPHDKLPCALLYALVKVLSLIFMTITQGRYD